jgi:hypothetical protein
MRCPLERVWLWLHILPRQLGRERLQNFSAILANSGNNLNVLCLLIRLAPYEMYLKRQTLLMHMKTSSLFRVVSGRGADC